MVEADEAACQKSEALMRVLREYSLLNPHGESEVADKGEVLSMYAGMLAVGVLAANEDSCARQVVNASGHASTEMDAECAFKVLQAKERIKALCESPTANKAVCNAVKSNMSSW